MARCADGAARACWPRPRAAPSRRSPTTASSLDPDETFVGTLNEDFAIESSAGDVFQLGNTSWRILQVAGGTVRVVDAGGAPPTIPFWLGEAPARSDELSGAVSRLRGDVESRCSTPATGVAPWLQRETGVERRRRGAARTPTCRRGGGCSARCRRRRRSSSSASSTSPAACSWCCTRRSEAASTRRGASRCASASAGSSTSSCRPPRPRMRSCCRSDRSTRSRSRTSSGISIPETTRDVLVQAFLDAPVFKTRWRWNTTISLAVPRARGGRRVAPPLQRMLADDLMAAVFPDAAACLENIPGDRQIPDHPLVSQTVRDCLQEAMDFDGLQRRPRPHSSRRAPAADVRHAGAVGLRARHPQRAPVCLPGRRAARGAAGAGGADSRQRPGDRRSRHAARWTSRPSRRFATKRVLIRGMPTSSTMR